MSGTMITSSAMSKNDFVKEFNALNAHIEQALAIKDFERAMRIDAARQQMLHEFAAQTVPDGDKDFFEALERCAADNARVITQLTADMGAMQRQAGQNLRGLKGYRTQRR